MYLVASFVYTFFFQIGAWISNYIPYFLVVQLLIHALSSMLISVGNGGPCIQHDKGKHDIERSYCLSLHTMHCSEKQLYWNLEWNQLCILLTHWGQVTHICVGNLTIIGSDNGLSPGRRQAIIWTNAGILLIGPLGTNLSEIVIEIHTFSFKKMHFKMSSAKWRLFGLGLNELK